MLEITISYRDNNIYFFAVKGHANFAPEGQDIYCAGVSAVTQTALLGLMKHLSVEPRFSVDKGWLECEIPASLGEEDVQKAQLILTTMEAGLLSMQEAYGDYIKVLVRRC